MGFQVERKAFLTCDDCGRTKQTATYSQKYDFVKVTIEDLYQDGSGSHSDFKMIDKREKYYCLECYRKHFK